MEVVIDQKAYRNILLFLNKPKGKEVIAYLLSRAIVEHSSADMPGAIRNVIAGNPALTPKYALDILRKKS